MVVVPRPPGTLFLCHNKCIIVVDFIIDCHHHQHYCVLCLYSCVCCVVIAWCFSYVCFAWMIFANHHWTRVRAAKRLKMIVCCDRTARISSDRRCRRPSGNPPQAINNNNNGLCVRLVNVAKLVSGWEAGCFLCVCVCRTSRCPVNRFFFVCVCLCVASSVFGCRTTRRTEEESKRNENTFFPENLLRCGVQLFDCVCLKAISMCAV